MKRYLTFILLFLSITLFCFIPEPCEGSDCVSFVKIEKHPKGKRVLYLPVEHINAIIADIKITEGVADVEFTDSFGQVLATLGNLRSSGIKWKTKIQDSKLSVKLGKGEFEAVSKALDEKPDKPGLRIQISQTIKKMSKDQVYGTKTKYKENRELLKSCDITSIAAPELTTKLTSPIKAAPGQALGNEITVLIENTGTAQAKNITVQLVISNSVDIPMQEAEYSINYKPNVLLEGGKVVIPSLEPGKNIKVELKGPFTIPEDTPPGKYYLGAIVDPANTIKELNEENNRDARFLNIEAPLAKMITMQLPNTFMVYQPGNYGLNVVSHEAVISDGKDWRKCKIRPFLHQLKHVTWGDFFLEIDSVERSVWHITKAKFCKKGGKAKELKFDTEITGGSKTTAPSRVLLKLPNTRLEFEPKGRKLRIITENFPIAYVSFWRVFQLKPHIFRFQHTLWPDFFWEVNTFANTVQKVTGISLGQAGGSGIAMDIKLKVELLK